MNIGNFSHRSMKRSTKLIPAAARVRISFDKSLRRGLENSFRSAQRDGPCEDRRVHRKDDPVAALRLGETLIKKAESLADTPEMGPPLPGKPNTRFLPVGAYLIIYRPDHDRQVVRILRFWHSARSTRPTQ